MKAVQVYYQCKGIPTIVHTDVEEIPVKREVSSQDGSTIADTVEKDG